MLTSSKLLRAYSKIIQVCSTFGMYTSALSKSANHAFADALPRRVTQVWLGGGKHSASLKLIF
ncbi:hypothetical protein BDQ17DRAFT_1354320, partial [Cyathus striatus]